MKFFSSIKFTLYTASDLYAFNVSNVAFYEKMKKAIQYTCVLQSRACMLENESENVLREVRQSENALK